MSKAYDRIDRYLRNNLNDADYAEYSEALEEVYATDSRWPNDAGLSWDGHRISGDKESIAAVQRALHEASTVESLKDRIKELEARHARS